ncbi:MAG TPA: hypothetical protein PKN21_09170 [Bacteroidales bacterium]|jgi:hypothetical protein|nr:hypothetical protein [Bacteroidales bacterium]
MLRAARNIALRLLDDDPQLLKPENQRMVRYLEYLRTKKSEWAMIS